MNDHFNQMATFLIGLGRRQPLSTVFNDFVTMGICTYHKTNIQTRLAIKDEQNEKLYMETIKKYEREELNTFAQALGELQMHIYDNPYSDPLGEFYMQNVSNGLNGEFFTPESLCEVLTLVHGEKGSIEKNTVYDPACGSGRLLLSFAKNNPDNHFYGTDVSNSCSKMATLSFFFNGLRGEVSWMNTLSMEWYGGWEINARGLGIVPIEKEHSRIWTAPPLQKMKVEPAPLRSDDPESEPMGQGIQLGLF